MDFLNTASSLGTVPTLIFLLCLVGAFLYWVIKTMAGISKSMKDIKEKQEKKDKEQDDKIAHLQQHYVSKEDMFQQFGGWRTEISNLSAQILHLTELMAGRKE